MSWACEIKKSQSRNREILCLRGIRATRDQVAVDVENAVAANSYMVARKPVAAGGPVAVGNHMAKKFWVRQKSGGLREILWLQ